VGPHGTVSFAYDPLGRRIRKSSPQGTTHFLWNGDVPLSERFAPATAEGLAHERTYVFEPGSFRPLALLQDGRTYYYHLDHLGTPLELSDAQGEVAWAVSYRSYGSVALTYEARIEQPLRFQGQYFDEETGLHYNRFRYYDPGCGRFINQDPIGLLGGTNNYEYVSNPTAWVDPYGLSAKPEDCSGLGQATEFRRSLEARARQQRMLEENVGYNISPISWDVYPTIGRAGSFLTDYMGVFGYFEDVASASRTTISKVKAFLIEHDMGLVPGSLQEGFKIRKVAEINARSPRSPMEGNEYFLGPGQHLPGGAPELVVDSIPTVDDSLVTTLLTVTVE